MKYKVLVNASFPECGVGLWKGTILDDEVEKNLTKEAVSRGLKDKWLEPIGEKKEKKVVSNEQD